MEFTTENHDPLSIDEEGLVIPSHLPYPLAHTLAGNKARKTYIFLQQIPLHWIRMLRNSKAIELVLESCANCLCSQ